MKTAEWFNRKLNIWHWYRVKFTYKDKKGTTLWDITMNRGVSGKRHIVNHRMLCKSINLYKIANENNLQLCNGKLSSDTICYLGYFKLK